MNGEPRPRHIIRRTFVSIVLLIVVSPASAGQFPEQTMELHMGPDAENRLVVGASTFGASLVTLDASKLRLFARPFETSRARGRVRTLDVRIGAPVLGPPHGFSVTHPLPYVVEQFSMPVTLAKAPRPPGIYDVWPMAVDGFARAEGGAEIPLHADGGFSAAYPEQFSWPDESDNDVALARLRTMLVGRKVYGFGGIAISCRPTWTKFYAASTPVRIRSIEREHGRAVWLGTGNAATNPDAMGAAFVAFDPISIVVDEPSNSRYPIVGMNSLVGGTSGPCPSIEVADWQVETTLSLSPPPATATTQAQLRIGATRDSIVWTYRYPNEVGTRATLRAEPTWHYGFAMGRYSVTFADDRVSSFTTPSRM